MAPSSKIILVTGASSGIGSASALRLAALGHTVYGAARRIERVEALAGHGVRPLPMDVTDDASMRAGIETIVVAEGRIDVLVNNAGYGSYGALEDVPLDEARRQFEVNVFGVARLTQLVLPHMRAQGSGRIVNVASAGGRVHGPLGSWYHATKWAVEAMSDCLRLDTRPFGIDVVVIEPGAIDTGFLGIATDALRAVSGDGPYARQAEGMLKRFADPAVIGRQSSPSVVAETIVKSIEAERPKTRYVIGFGARPLLFLRHWLPDRAFDALITRVAGTAS